MQPMAGSRAGMVGQGAPGVVPGAPGAGMYSRPGWNPQDDNLLVAIVTEFTQVCARRPAGQQRCPPPHTDTFMHTHMSTCTLTRVHVEGLCVLCIRAVHTRTPLIETENGCLVC